VAHLAYRRERRRPLEVTQNITVSAQLPSNFRLDLTQLPPVVEAIRSLASLGLAG
jgi:hypothetical protein